MDAVIESGDLRCGGEGPFLAWTVAHRPKTMNAPSGDGYLVRWIADLILLAVADGAGSGPEAAQATAKCLQALEETQARCLKTLFTQTHCACQGSRGTALAITLIDPSVRQITWAAVGDVEGFLLRGSPSAPRQREGIIQRGGTLGYNLPTIISQSHEIGLGDTIIMSSDGIRHSYRGDISHKSVEALARYILQTHSRDHDDALVLVARLDGSSCPVR